MWLRKLPPCLKRFDVLTKVTDSMDQSSCATVCALKIRIKAYSRMFIRNKQGHYPIHTTSPNLREQRTVKHKTTCLYNLIFRSIAAFLSIYLKSRQEIHIVFLFNTYMVTNAASDATIPIKSLWVLK